MFLINDHVKCIVFQDSPTHQTVLAPDSDEDTP